MGKVGPITLALGFDAKTMHVTVDGKPYGEPVMPFGEDDIRETLELAARRPTHRERLMGGVSKRGVLWGNMPKPDGDK